MKVLIFVSLSVSVRWLSLKFTTRNRPGEIIYFAEINIFCTHWLTRHNLYPTHRQTHRCSWAPVWRVPKATLCASWWSHFLPLKSKSRRVPARPVRLLRSFVGTKNLWSAGPMSLSGDWHWWCSKYEFSQTSLSCWKMLKLFSNRGASEDHASETMVILLFVIFHL